MRQQVLNNRKMRNSNGKKRDQCKILTLVWHATVTFSVAQLQSLKNSGSCQVWAICPLSHNCTKCLFLLFNRNCRAVINVKTKSIVGKRNTDYPDDNWDDWKAIKSTNWAKGKGSQPERFLLQWISNAPTLKSASSPSVLHLQTPANV